ncbi:MAG: carboxypeptidase-like regulatory domain-containing protein [Melioribacteraceae bacterium]
MTKIFVLIHCEYISAQISGTVLDSILNSLIEYAMVSLLNNADEKFNEGTITDVNGDLIFGNLPLGLYKIKVLIVGYNTEYVNNIELSESNHVIEMGLIKLSNYFLNEIQVTDQKQIIEHHLDKLV